MKILNKDEFLKLPAGIVYCCNENANMVGFNDLRIKGDTLNAYLKADEKPSSWWEISLTEYQHNDTGELLKKHEEMLNGASYSIDICATRNGLYEPENIFLVYEQHDLEALIAKLKECRGVDK